MRYAAFERLVLVLGGASVLATLALASSTGLQLQDVAAQLMVFGVLVGAVHWGRRGGFIAAIIASITYVVIWIPMLEPDTITAQLLTVMFLRVLAYGLIGIVGGTLCGKMKYVLASLEQGSRVDEVTGIFSEQMLARLIDAAAARFERYAEPFCLVVIELAGDSLRAPITNRDRVLVRHVASHIRGDIRMMDEACRIDDGRFVVLLPHTPKSGGVIVADRLAKDLGKTAAATDQGCSARAQCLCAAEDTEAIAKFRSGLRAGIEDQVLSPA